MLLPPASAEIHHEVNQVICDGVRPSSFSKQLCQRHPRKPGDAVLLLQPTQGMSLPIIRRPRLGTRATIQHFGLKQSLKVDKSQI